MKYKLTIEKIESNPKYDKRDIYRSPKENETLITKALEVIFEDIKFVSVKKAIMEAIK